MSLSELNKEINVNTSEECFKFYKCFCGEQSIIETAIFPKYSNLYVLCAGIGYNLNKRTPLINPTRCSRSGNIGFEKELPTLMAIAYNDPQDGHDVSIFKDLKKVFSICDEYAETGIRYLMEQYPFKNIYANGEIINNEKLDLEFSVMMLLKELKDSFSNQLI